MKSTNMTALLVAVMLALTGCADPGANGQHGTPDAALTTVATELSREIFVDVPALMQNVKQNRGAVVVGTVSNSVEAPGAAAPDGTPILKGQGNYQAATNSRVTVIQQISGTSTPASFTLHQLLGPDSEYSGLPKLRDGQTYLMVVRPFAFGRPDQGGDQFIVVGFEAAWKQVGSQYEWINATSQSGAKYPASIAANDVTGLFAEAN